MGLVEARLVAFNCCLTLPLFDQEMIAIACCYEIIPLN